MPPLDAIVAVLRWAKDHDSNSRLTWISHILPLQMFADICRKVYFAVDEYSDIDLILANVYLSYVFSEYVVASGLQEYRRYCQLCRENLYIALSRLPLLLPATIELIAALTLGAMNAIENSKVTMAWTFISGERCLPTIYSRKFIWVVHKLEKGLSLRLGRSSNIRDIDITLQFDRDVPRPTRLAKIQGNVYDQLYSPAGLSRPEVERGYMAESLAGELRELINETQLEVLEGATERPDDLETDPIRVVYLYCDLVCQTFLLAFILRAVPTKGGNISGVSDECVAVAQDALDIHEKCMMEARGCKNDAFMVTKYINWAILHCPFVPFNILFDRAVQLLDIADLARLDCFAASFQPDAASPESITHPYRLYKLLCETVRLYFDLNTSSSSSDTTLIHNTADSFSKFELAHYGIDGGVAANDILGVDGAQAYGLSGWYYGNQQIMGLLDEDVLF
ncbi:hypothetical protein N431DRAFT_485113 [Stipitochalara longipes BDJ]|nr:hypothetical protein N431DRAFT_485113 [Stipitochalara longipes BDJ]